MDLNKERGAKISEGKGARGQFQRDANHSQVKTLIMATSPVRVGAGSKVPPPSWLRPSPPVSSPECADLKNHPVPLKETIQPRTSWHCGDLGVPKSKKGSIVFTLRMILLRIASWLEETPAQHTWAKPTC